MGEFNCFCSLARLCLKPRLETSPFAIVVNCLFTCPSLSVYLEPFPIAETVLTSSIKTTSLTGCSQLHLTDQKLF